jgi:hypothetical protein
LVYTFGHESRPGRLLPMALHSVRFAGRRAAGNRFAQGGTELPPPGFCLSRGRSRRICGSATSQRT